MLRKGTLQLTAQHRSRASNFIAGQFVGGIDHGDDTLVCLVIGKLHDSRHSPGSGMGVPCIGTTMDEREELITHGVKE